MNELRSIIKSFYTHTTHNMSFVDEYAALRSALEEKFSPPHHAWIQKNLNSLLEYRELLSGVFLGRGEADLARMLDVALSFQLSACREACAKLAGPLSQSRKKTASASTHVFAPLFDVIFRFCTISRGDFGENNIDCFVLSTNMYPCYLTYSCL